MRLQLARALMCPADLLLLDEPTNHLDLDALVWLEAWLKRYEGTMLVISHDREFLDAITKRHVHLDEARSRATAATTPPSRRCAPSAAAGQAAFGKQQEKMAHLQRFIDRFKAKASKAKQAQSRVKALARMEKLAPVLTSARLSSSNSASREPAQPDAGAQRLAAATAAGRSRAERERSSCAASPARVLAGQRIGILGANGQGKSTLVKTIARALPPLGGASPRARAWRSATSRSRRWTCCVRTTGRCSTWCAWRAKVSPQAREQELRDFLGQFRFTGDMVTRPWARCRRREGAPGAGDAGVAAPQPAAAGRTHQPPRPDHAATREALSDGAQRVRGHA
jgi:ATP-binding cassette subfamily F protein 3